MHKTIAAQYIFTNVGEPIKKGYVTYDDASGKILAIGQLTAETANTTFYNGVLVPGFVNAHCHLELAYCKGLIPPCEHLIDFLRQISRCQRSLEFDETACKNADDEMYRNGINLVGDISNTADSASIKRASKIRYLNFVELIGTTDEQILKSRNIYNKVSAEFAKNPKSRTVAVPHAPYSVSPGLFDTINNINSGNKAVISIHNQETEAENELYISHTGSIVDNFPFDLSPIPTTGKKSLESYCGYLSGYDNVLLVHNTFSQKDDFQVALQTLRNPHFVLCPKSNLYLEGRLPDVETMLQMGLNICIGTDSLSSNDTLSILEEMKVLAHNFNYLSFDNILRMATINGAQALGYGDDFGKLQVGGAPGLLLMEMFDFQDFNITKDTTVRRIC